ncbi:hypothetical protein PCANC_28045, partial [Puccinia coronata f. sp. avenae]
WWNGPFPTARVLLSPNSTIARRTSFQSDVGLVLLEDTDQVRRIGETEIQQAGRFPSPSSLCSPMIFS